jgi:hypothetical protein
VDVSNNGFVSLTKCGTAVPMERTGKLDGEASAKLRACENKHLNVEPTYLHFWYHCDDNTATMCVQFVSQHVGTVLFVRWLMPSELEPGPECNNSLSRKVFPLFALCCRCQPDAGSTSDNAQAACAAAAAAPCKPTWHNPCAVSCLPCAVGANQLL